MNNKILFLGRFPPPVHGAAKMNEIYYESLSRDFEVKKIKINPSVDFENIGKVNLAKGILAILVFFRILKEILFFRPKIVYFEIPPKGIAFYRDSIYVILLKIFKKKMLFALHAQGLKKVRGLARIYYRFIFRKSKVILLSERLYDDVKEIISKENVYFVSNGIKDEVKQIKKNKEMKFIFLSNMMESKGPVDALVFAELLKEKKMKFKMTFVGSFENENFKKKWFSELKKRNLEDDCFYIGPKYDNDKVKELLDKSFLLFPSKNECYPLVILEAFMCGLPVLAYDVGAIKDIVDKDYLGVVSDKKSLKDLLAKFLDNKKKFNPDKIRKEFLEKHVIRLSEQKLKSVINKEIRNG